MLNELKKLKTIPQVVAKEKLLNDMKGCDILFKPFSLERCESVRKDLRGLMHFIPDKKQYHIIDASDFLFAGGDTEAIEKEKPYAEKVRDYLASDAPVLTKISNLDALTSEEIDELRSQLTVKLGTNSEFAELSQGKPMLAYVRSQVGITEQAVKTKFGSLLNENVLTPQQLTYMQQMVSYARENGDMVARDLQTVSPFKDWDITTLFGEKIALVKQLLDGIHKPVMEKK